MGTAALGFSHSGVAAIADIVTIDAPAAWMINVSESTVSAPVSAQPPMLLAAGPRDRVERRQDHRENSRDRVDDKQDHREDRRDLHRQRTGLPCG